ncbi:hypothetical protein FEK43_21875, partial [Escherichia sp. E2562]
NISKSGNYTNLCTGSFPFSDRVRFVHAGCGVNALSGHKIAQIQYIALICRPDKRSASGNVSANCT